MSKLKRKMYTKYKKAFIYISKIVQGHESVNHCSVNLYEPSKKMPKRTHSLEYIRLSNATNE